MTTFAQAQLMYAGQMHVCAGRMLPEGHQMLATLNHLVERIRDYVTHYDIVPGSSWAELDNAWASRPAKPGRNSAGHTLRWIVYYLEML